MRQLDYKQLKVWQKAMELAENIYNIVRLLPKEEMYALSDQMRRSVISIPSNIAEGRGRNSEKEFMQFLSIARGSAYELSTQLEICHKVGYLNESTIKNSIELCEEVGKMINSLSKKLYDKITKIASC